MKTKKSKSTCGSPMTMVLRSKGPKVKNSSQLKAKDLAVGKVIKK